MKGQFYIFCKDIPTEGYSLSSSLNSNVPYTPATPIIPQKASNPILFSFLGSISAIISSIFSRGNERPCLANDSLIASLDK